MKAEPTTRQLIEMLYERLPELFDRPTREWVGLTRDDRVEILRANGEAAVLNLTEAKLREKNAAPFKPLTDGLDVKQLNHCMMAVRDWLSGGCDINDIPRPHIAVLVAFTARGIKGDA